MTSWDALGRARVFWPGDELPVGVVVMRRDGSIAKAKFSGIKVQHLSWKSPLVEVVLPDWEKAVRAAGPRRVDPPGCRCDECGLGLFSQPLDETSYEALQRLMAGEIQDSTGEDLEEEYRRRWDSFRQLLDGGDDGPAS